MTTIKEEVSQLLVELEKIDKNKIPLKDSNVDMDRILEVKEIKEVVDKLKELKVDSEWLFKNGFVPAGIMLGRLLK